MAVPGPASAYPGLPTWQATADNLRFLRPNIFKLYYHIPLKNWPANRSFTRRLEEREGFEPSIPFAWNNRFRGDRIRPLCHLSIQFQFI